ncbi:MAG: hypothetical protein KME45_12190 [Stenomitos rutilans HA7619-LM2]|jgi:hypothetical protein|nr:hypothetical protein [Stenomitos rutilans HA7619-LM2]
MPLRLHDVGKGAIATRLGAQIKSHRYQVFYFALLVGKPGDECAELQPAIVRPAF